MVRNDSPYVRVRPVTYSYTQPLRQARTTPLKPIDEPKGVVNRILFFAKNLFD